MMTDPVADMLTRIRNASSSGHPQVEMPASKIKEVIARIMKEEGYIEGYEVIGEAPHKQLNISLKYTTDHQAVITGVERVSRPGRRVYVGRDRVPKVLNGLGIAILSTPKGVMTGNRSVRTGVGGEVICYIW